MRLRQPPFLGLLLVLLGLLVFSAPLTTSVWEPWLQRLIYDASGHLRPDDAVRRAGIFFFRELYDHHVMWPIGVFLMVSGLGLALRGRIPWSRNRLTRAAQILGTVVTCASIFFTLPVFLVNPGSSMGLVGWGVLVLGLTLVGLLFALSAGVPALLRDNPRMPALVGLLLCLAPLPVSLALLSLAHAMVGFRISA